MFADVQSTSLIMQSRDALQIDARHLNMAGVGKNKDRHECEHHQLAGDGLLHR